MASYLFIDGNYLRRQFEKQMQSFYGVVPSLDFAALASHLGGERTYYYDAIDYQQAEIESEAAWQARVGQREALHHSISGLTGFHVREGHVRRAAKKKPRQQKAVDVMLAVDAMEHAARRNMTHATLLAGDLDFEPLLASLVRLGIHTKLAYFPTVTSSELKKAADQITKITLQHLWDWSAPSFKANYRQVLLQYRQARPNNPNHQAVRHGKWKERDVTLFRAPGMQTSIGVSLLFVAQGDELTEPSLLFSYPDVEKLPLAFELTFGPVSWQTPAAVAGVDLAVRGETG